jgi:hypothetical protein
VLAGCGGGDEPPEVTATPDPGVDALAGACAEYREAALAELPPASPSGYQAYMREQRELIDRFVAAIEQAPAGEARGRLLAAGSQILGGVNDLERVTPAGGLYARSRVLGQNMDVFDDAAEAAGVPCGAPPEPSPEVREFRAGAAEVCDASGRTQGLPRRDAELIRARVEGHAELELPAEASRLERDTLAAERELARIAATAPRSQTIQARVAEYVTLAVRTSEGWRRQGVEACVDLPLAEVS